MQESSVCHKMSSMSMCSMITVGEEK